MFKKITVLLNLFFFATLSGCITNQDTHSEKLSETLLREAEQIYPISQGIILHYGKVINEFEKDYYLAFFNEEFTLTSSCVISSKGIINIQNDTIFFYEDNYPKIGKTNKLPFNLKLKPIGVNGGGRRRNKVIDKIELIDEGGINNTMLKIEYSKAKESYYRDRYAIKNSQGLEQDSIFLNIKDIHCDGHYLYTISFDEDTGMTIGDYYLPNNSEQLDLYYQPFINLLDTLSNNR